MQNSLFTINFLLALNLPKDAFILEALSYETNLHTKGQMHPNNEHLFQESRRKELDGLTTNGVFQAVSRHSVPTGTRVQRSKWVDVLKTDSSGKPYEKSGLVVQGCRDYEAANIATRSPTVTRLAQRLVLAPLPCILNTN